MTLRNRRNRLRLCLASVVLNGTGSVMAANVATLNITQIIGTIDSAKVNDYTKYWLR